MGWLRRLSRGCSGWVAAGEFEVEGEMFSLTRRVIRRGTAEGPRVRGLHGRDAHATEGVGLDVRGDVFAGAKSDSTGYRRRSAGTRTAWARRPCHRRCWTGREGRCFRWREG